MSIIELPAKDLVKIPAGADPVWEKIVKSSAYWFSKETMRFFSSRILWDTLTETATAGTYLFVSSERNYDGSKRLYTVRYYAATGVETITFTGFRSSEIAKELVKAFAPMRKHEIFAIRERLWQEYLNDNKPQQEEN